MSSTALRTQADVSSLELPSGKTEALFFDEGKTKDRAPGLALRVREGGSRKFVFLSRHAGKQIKITIGDAHSWTLDKARAAARDFRVKIDKGENPATEKAERRAASALTFAAVRKDYLAAREKDLRPRTYEMARYYLEEKWAPLDNLPLASVERANVATTMRKIAEGSGPIAANRARGALSSFFAWCIGEGLCDSNPVMGTNKAAEEKTRDRVLSDDELVAIWNACPDNDYGRIVRLLMLTGQRRDEMGSLRWSEIVAQDDSAKAHIALPGSRTKNGRPHDVPLSGAALGVLKAATHIDGRSLVFGSGDGGYSGWSKAKATLDKASGAKDWTLHDLRRTMATRMADLGVQPHVIEAVINHVSGHKAGVAGIYNRSTYAAEKRAALDTWASHMQTILALAEGANVTTLRRPA